jgi:hypothetical protein
VGFWAINVDSLKNLDSVQKSGPTCLLTFLMSKPFEKQHKPLAESLEIRHTQSLEALDVRF